MRVLREIMETKIYLTIDGGPSERTGELLAYLKLKRFGAILFCKGDHLQDRRELAVRAIHDGYIIGNHAYDHPHFSILSEGQVRAQIARTDELIDQIYIESGVQRPARFFRFPYGDAGANKQEFRTNQRILRELGYWSPIHSPRRDWGWSFDVKDWDVDASNAVRKLELAKESLKTLRPGAVLLLHDHPVNFEVGLFQSICDCVLELGFTFYTNENLQDQIMNHRPLRNVDASIFDEEIYDLRSENADLRYELSAITTSFMYRCMKSLATKIDHLFPDNTRRGKFRKRITQALREK